jgi:hypothetical protein
VTFLTIQERATEALHIVTDKVKSASSAAVAAATKATTNVRGSSRPMQSQIRKSLLPAGYETSYR